LFNLIQIRQLSELEGFQNVILFPLEGAKTSNTLSLKNVCVIFI
jgi:hypothetical protein